MTAHLQIQWERKTAEWERDAETYLCVYRDMREIEQRLANPGRDRRKSLTSVAKLYEHHAPRAMKFAHVLTGHDDIAGDLVQEAFVRVVARRRRGEAEPEAFDRYLRTAIMNLWRSKLRRRKLERRHSRAESRAHGVPFPDVETSDSLWQAVGKLSPRQRAAVYLRFYEDLPAASIARQLDCSEGAVRSLLTHALQKLRRETGVTDGKKV